MKIAKEGYPFILISLLVFLGAYFFNPYLGLAFFILLLLVLQFFRDPERTTPSDPGLVVTGADGRVLDIETLAKSEYFNFPHKKISIFMSPFNVHVNRVPMDGIIKDIKYVPGKFFNASLNKASTDNERNALWIEDHAGDQVAFVQIAGLIARRILSYAKVGEYYTKGQRFGIIRFGSRMEIYLPEKWEVLVKKGDKIYAGASPVARKMS